MKRTDITLNIGIDTSDEEIEMILSSFPEEINVDCKKSVVRLSADYLPLVINFTIGAVLGGVLYDSIKYSLKLLLEKCKSNEIKREINISIKTTKHSYEITPNKILCKKTSSQIEFTTIDELVDKIKSDNE